MGHHNRSASGRGIVAVCASICFWLFAGPVSAAGLIGTRAAHISPAVTMARIDAVQVVDGAEAAQLTFDISQSIEPTAFVMASPDRAVIDLPQVDFAMDPGTGKLGSGRDRRSRSGLLGSFRFGLLAPGRSRIVIDLAQPARIVRAVVQSDHGSSKLIVDLAKTDRASFRAAALTHDSATFAASAPAAAGEPALANGKATVVIDPGHGGPDTGAIVNGVVEKEVTLAFAKLLASKLEASGRFNVVMTRATDTFIPLSGRVQIARNAAAALMISVHADTLPEDRDVSGATVYTVSDKASDAYAAKVAAKENAADTAVGVDGQGDVADVNDILFDLTRQETRAYSHVFARTLVNYWKVAGRLNKNPQRAAGFVVLKAPDVPSVLLELGYLSSPSDAAALTSDAWRETATARMAEAVKAYFADQHGPAKAAAGVSIPLHQVSFPAAR